MSKMDTKKFLIWIDILGFEDLAEEIGEKKRTDTRKIRKDFRSLIKEKVNEVIKKKIIIGKNYGRKDDWTLVAEDLQKAFLAISEILDHYTGYDDYPKIPLEIAIGSEEYDRWAKFDGEGVFDEGSTIKWIKTKIVNRYHKLYKEKYNQQIKGTFVLISDSVYAELKEDQREKCERYSYEVKNEKGEIKKYNYYHLPLNVIEREKKISDFLNKINQPQSDYSGALIDKVFIPPDEFDEIKERLENDRIVFITGTAGYGKTYP